MEQNQQVDYDKLVQQTRVDALFRPLENQKDHLEKIEIIKFLFKNCCYNESRVVEEINRLKSGFRFPGEEEKRRIADNFGLSKVGARLEMGIPTTVGADILVFEFHSLLSNIIRCCNFLVTFKLKNVDKNDDIRYATIGKYFKNNLPKNVKVIDKGDLHKLILTQCQEWIDWANYIRNEIVHEHVVRELEGTLIFSYERISEDSVEAKGYEKLRIPQYKINDLDEYVAGIMKKLEIFIGEFFRVYGNNLATKT